MTDAPAVIDNQAASRFEHTENGRLAQLTYRQALLVRVQAQASRLTDTAALFQALGGGWWNREAAEPKEREQRLRCRPPQPQKIAEGAAR